MLAAAAITPFFNLLTSRASVAEAVQGFVDAVRSFDNWTDAIRFQDDLREHGLSSFISEGTRCRANKAKRS